MKLNGHPKLENAVNGEREVLERRAGPVSLYTAGSGTPILLLHSINAAASVAEMAPTFEHLRHSRRVYAPDLPGFGFSDRSKRTYDIDLYVNSILDVLDRIAEESGDKPIDAVGLSLSSELLARVAAEQPQRFRSLTLITPTGFRAGSDKLRAPPGTTRYMPVLNGVLTFALWRSALYQALVSPRSIRYFLRRTYGSPNIDETLASYCDITTHQPGAEHAPYAFLSGALFGKDIRNVYESLTMPVFLAHGTRGDFADFRGADWTGSRSNWRVSPYAAGAMLHFECRVGFQSELGNFLTQADG
jgi:pimeloyl-ACP methyl ester carboxylesterase